MSMSQRVTSLSLRAQSLNPSPNRAVHSIPPPPPLRDVTVSQDHVVLRPVLISLTLTLGPSLPLSRSISLTLTLCPFLPLSRSIFLTLTLSVHLSPSPGLPLRPARLQRAQLPLRAPVTPTPPPAALSVLVSIRGRLCRDGHRPD